ncbi:uncharacterized protein LOC125659895 [Ostrea edulis]|uniref:uncharacterized protein LOC125659895 n=1 Tax=Ostrea edulis TaxID=37623 RepID=UPI0024AEC5EB|nr:uncharacterized protein LOC125659895 [Ostrea edulis]
MLIRFILVGLLAGVFSVPLKENEEDFVRKEVRELLEFLKEPEPEDDAARVDHYEKGRRLFRDFFGEEDEDLSKRKIAKAEENENNPEKDQKEKSPKKHSKMIDEDNVDPDDVQLMELLEGMAVEKNGKVSQAKGLHPELSAVAKGQGMDKHPLTKDQAEIEGMPQDQERRKKRSFWRAAWKWPKNIVPFNIDNNTIVRQGSYDAINKAAELFNNLTCLKWLPYTPELAEELGHNNYVQFRNSDGCWSYVGYIASSPQSIGMSEPGCMSVGIAVHEMLHAVGLMHEQSRSDRDDNIRMIKENLKHNINNGNMAKTSTFDHNAYDYESIMQYSLWAFSVTGGQSMEFLDRDLEFLAGTGAGVGLDFYDVKDITVNYQCTKDCVNPPKCENGGFVNHKCVCYCPKGYDGARCENVISDDDCGGMVEVPLGKDVYVTSPGYPVSYPLGKICRWGVKAPDGWYLRMTVEELHLTDNNLNRCYHWLEIQYNLAGQTGIKRCGDLIGDEWTGSKDSPNFMTLTFDSKFVQDRPVEKGFKLRFNAVGRGCKDNPCVYGTCHESKMDCKFTCSCFSGFEGELCNKMTDDATFECTFEKKKCFLENTKEGDDFDWAVNSGTSSSQGTGPDKAYKGNNYVFAEMSDPRVKGEKAWLVSNLEFPASERCLSFHYYMFGHAVDSLNVFVSGENRSRSIVWSESGNQGSVWKFAKVDIDKMDKLKIVFEAVRGEDWSSDIALDNVVLDIGRCSNVTENIECLKSSRGGEYKGKVNVTKSGRACQAWAEQTPHSHSGYAALVNDSNYCRNLYTNGNDYHPWCYTMDSGKRWEFCNIPPCEYEECRRSKIGYEYAGRVSRTKSGKACQRWDSQSPHQHTYKGLMAHENYCRNPKGKEQEPFCFTEDNSTRWEYCDVPSCNDEPRECALLAQGIDYFGKINTTTSGRSCQRWDQQNPHSHSMPLTSAQENFCRNMGGENRAWCYTTDPQKRWERCNIPSCDNLPCFSSPCLNGGTCTNQGNSFTCSCFSGYRGDRCEEEVPIKSENCKRSAYGWEYKGTIALTVSNRTCQRWNETTPHSHTFTTSMAGHENYCRNPDKESGPWCYTTDPGKRFELCDIPMCDTPPSECLNVARGADYFGHANKTINGYTCMRWDSQSPQKHSYGYIGEQENYCRNPYGGEPKGPWCYTTDPKKRWEYCTIPLCGWKV